LPKPDFVNGLLGFQPYRRCVTSIDKHLKTSGPHHLDMASTDSPSPKPNTFSACRRLTESEIESRRRLGVKATKAMHD
jgi:hypothetical protein